ncbi:unnamed protein product [Alternaria alternata]
MSPHTPSLQGADPSTSGNVIRGAFAFESAITVAAGSYFLFFPRHYLGRILAVQMTQQYGAANIFVGGAVSLYVSNNRAAVESRKMVYRYILGWELLFVPVVVCQALMMEGGIPKSSLLATAGQFVPFIAWRVFALFCKPEWFESYQERKKAE